MSERGILRIVVEGDDAQLFHDGLTEFITESKENPNYRIEDPSGELYWCIGEYEGNDKYGETTCIDCYYLIDDRDKNGAAEFEGELIRYGSEKFPDWDAVLEYLIR